MESEELMRLLEATIVRDSLNLYMNKLTEYKGHPNYEQTMAFVGSLYKKYSRVAGQRIVTDDFGRVVLLPDLRRNFDLN